MLQLPTNPKAGRSRFSKALPAVPNLDLSASLPPPPQFLPSLPPLSSSPSPSPSLSISKKPVASATTMSIPRKPVGKLEVSTSTMAPTPAPPTPQPPSPSDSINSILSAYSRSSGESLVKTSDGTMSKRESNSTTSPVQVASVMPPTVPKGSLPRPAQSLTRKAVGGGGPPPSPPTKDDRFQPLVSPVAPKPSGSEIGTPSASQPQIWRRRSRSSSRGMTGLKLEFSNGFTASSQVSAQIPQAQPSQETLKAAPPVIQPVARTMGLPGRNIRPAAPAASPPVPEKDASKPKSDEKPLPVMQHETVSNHPVIQRPPTPEYQKEDVKTPVVGTFISPVSPATSPEPSQGQFEPPKQAPSEVEQPRSAQLSGGVLSSSEKPVIPNPDLHSARSVPNFRSKAPPPANEPLPRGDMGRGRFGGDMAPPNHFRHSGESTGSRARSASARPGQRRPMEQSKPVPPELDPRLVYSETQGYLYKGRDGTLYPEMKEKEESDPRAFAFPSRAQEMLPLDTIHRAAPLKSTHYDCFQSHRSVNRKTNRNYSLACQTCERSDAEDRWCCSFCNLRMCDTCFRTFGDNQRNLQRLMDTLGRGPQHSAANLTSSEWAESALGILSA